MTRPRFSLPATAILLALLAAGCIVGLVGPARGASPSPGVGGSAGPTEGSAGGGITAEIRARLAKLALLDARQAALAHRLLDLDRQLADLAARRAVTLAEAARARATLAATEDQLAQSRAREATLRSALAGLLRRAYAASRTPLLAVLLGAGSLVDGIVALAETEALGAELQATRDRLQAEIARQVALEGVVTTTLTRLAGLRAEIDVAAAELTADHQEMEAILDALAAEELAQRADLAAAQAELQVGGLNADQAAAEARALATKPTRPGGGAPAGVPATPGPSVAPSPAPAATVVASAPPSAPPGPGVASPPPSPAPPSFPSSPAPSPTPSPSSLPSAGASPGPGPGGTLPAMVTFYGRGTDHGVGLSQWGARGRALAGETAAQILAAYYQGTTLGTVDPALTVRVLVVDGFVPTAADPATVRGAGGPFTVDGLAVAVPAGGTATLVPGVGGWTLVVSGPDGGLLGQLPGVGDAWIRPADPATRLQVVFRPSYYDTYRGAIHLVAAGGTVEAINVVALDDYLLGVIPAEMPASWPAAALAAQAIAARSYAVAHLQPASLYDLTADTGSQVYLGALYEKPATTAAVASTAGQVVMSAGRVANALFHSTGGGATENNENVFVAPDGRPLAAPVSYLRGIWDRDASGRPYDADSPWATWQTATYSIDALSAIFANDPRTAVGRLIALDLSHRGVSGRLISVTLVGTAGTKTVSGAYFKYVFNVYSPATDPAMRSTLFDLAPVP